jgi:hypothetical protein
MRTKHHLLFCFGFVLAIGHPFALSAEDEIELNPRVKPQVMRDIMWVWSTPEMDQEGEHTLATWAFANTVQKMQLLNLQNAMMCGSGLPDNDEEAIKLTEDALSANRMVWEIVADDGSHKPPFAYTKTAARIRRLYDKYPKIEAVLLDDMTSLSVNAGFEAKHIRAIRDLLPDKYLDIKIWGVVYTMNMRQPVVDEIIKALDVVHLWVWHGRDLADLDEHVAFIEELAPEKPIVLGLYLHDYGEGRSMPLDILQQQCQTALRLAHAGRIEGMVFLTVINNAEVLQWTADWIQEVGDQKIGEAP